MWQVQVPNAMPDPGAHEASQPRAVAALRLSTHGTVHSVGWCADHNVAYVSTRVDDGGLQTLLPRQSAS